jgi:RHS repeat-associated protein
MKNKFVIALASIAIFTTNHAFAQVGNDNPTGPSGAFNGNIGTTCSYDPYTGNAMRTVTDITVSGGVGTIPLALTRIYNSRSASPINTLFGVAGSWQHNYTWSIPDGDETGDPNNVPLPSSYAVSFPDGRNETFSYSASDTYYRAALGTRERFVPFAGTIGDLILPDGSKVEFIAKVKHFHDGETGLTSYWYSFTAQALIDPYGQRTTLTYNTDGTLQKVTEPAGRYLQFFYTTVSGLRVIDHVTSSDSRTVQYSYVQAHFSPGTQNYVCLDHIVYYGDSTWTAHYKYRAPNVGSANGIPLLWTCDDPLYAGPMKRIGCVYATANNADGSSPVYGEILSENYYDGTNVGAAASTLSVNGSTRTETRGDGSHPTRTFTYTGYKLTSETDFKGISASITYDTNSYVSSLIDRNGHTTNFTLNPLVGAILTATFPSTPGDTPSGTPRGIVTNTFGWTGCPDANNRDANNPYYLYSVTDEGGNTTTYARDTNKRVTQINYPDGGFESFTYNSFGQVLTHVMTTGGTEAFTYDATGVRQTYRDSYHDPINQIGNPGLWYSFDSVNRLSGVTDALGTGAGDVNHTTSFAYNARNQLTSTTKPTDPVDGQRHTITNVYNSDGTLASTTDELGHVTSLTYDDYKRLLAKTTSPRYTGDNTSHLTSVFYDANGTGPDYTHTDSNATHVTLPGGEKTTTAYDANFRKTSVTFADGTTDAAKIGYSYDNAGNVTSIMFPKEQTGQPNAGQSANSAYDERNRLMSTTNSIGNITSCTYDAAGRNATATRPNGQLITYDSYDPMNRVLQRTVKQTPDPDAVTKYAYYASGLLHTMQDPRLVANNSIYNYNCAYDQMGRKTSVTYPPDSGNAQRSEAWHYDTAGRIDTFTNRSGNIETLTIDPLNRLTAIAWNDNGVTPNVSLHYDVASRLTSVVNANATIARTYFNDNLLNTETSTYSDSTARTVTYTYNADSNRATIQYPNGAYSFTYSYTSRNQLKTIANTSPLATIITYAYDTDGNLTARTPDNGTGSTYTYDALDRVTDITHALNGTTRTFDYGYDNVSNRKWTKRDGGNGDVFGYDLGDQVTATLLNVSNPDTTSPGSQTISYDANGNRTTFAAYGTTDTYITNNLNQYSARNLSQATYNNNGNMTTGVDGSTYTYDSQNRLLTATRSGLTNAFTFDGLNRQVSRKVGAGPPTYNVYDGWQLIGEYAAGATSPSNAYLSGAGGLTKNLTSNMYYYQDASGSTSHLTDNTGHLAEWYRYDLHGTPIFYNSINTQLGASNYGVRHLFTGQQWYSEVGLYDLRNRFYSPDIGRFLQADPIGFSGDANNLYRYCGNDPVKFFDPWGLWQLTIVGGAEYGGYITVGYNSGQLNFGGFAGLADGLAVSFNPNNSGLQDAGLTAGVIATAGAGAGKEALGITSYDGSDGNSVSVTGAAGPIEGGFKLAQQGLVSEGGSLTFGAAMFAGVGVIRYTEAPFPAPGGTTDVDPSICPECAVAERVVVTGTAPPSGSGTTVTTSWGATAPPPGPGFTYVNPWGGSSAIPTSSMVQLMPALNAQEIGMMMWSAFGDGLTGDLEDPVQLQPPRGR